MKNSLRRSLILVLLFLPLGGYSQNMRFPSWVLYGMGAQAYENRQFDQALLYFREAIKVRGIFPEAEIMAGRIYGIGGDQTLRKRQLEKAYSQKEMLEVKEDQYEILYQLAELADQRTGPDKGKLRQEVIDGLLLILKDDQVFQKAEKGQLTFAYARALLETNGPAVGLDRILLLYRDRLTFSLRAHVWLSQLYFEGEAYNKSLSHSLMVFVSLYSELLDRLREYEPIWQFKSLKEYHELVFSGLQIYKPSLEYMESSALLETLSLIAANLKGIANRLQSDPSKLRLYEFLLPALGDGVAREPEEGLKVKALIERLNLRGIEVENLKSLLIRDLISQGINPTGVF